MHLVRARDLKSPSSQVLRQHPDPWDRKNLEGRLVELSQDHYCGSLTWAAHLIRQTQEANEQALWIAGTSSVFYPPDMARAGVDLERLPVVWAPGAQQSLGAAEIVLRTGSFSLLIIDLGKDFVVPTPLLGRIGRLAQDENTRIVFLTLKPHTLDSMNSLISLRAQVRRTGGVSLVQEVAITKNKQGPTLSPRRSVYYGPPGLY
ncbi:MAG: DNA recombination/repair protein RecA [Spirochaetales bacterium]|nr:DNA recombination/repair protein RecA [Spirochaetales bacterium]